MLLPSAFQDKDIPCTLGKKVERQEPAKTDPIREFERHNHDIPCTAKLPDEYVKEAAKEMKRQWEENLDRAMAMKVSDAFSKWLERKVARESQSLEATIPSVFKRADNKAQREALYARIDALKAESLLWPKIDASAVPVGQSFFMYGVEK
jgi:transketolase